MEGKREVSYFWPWTGEFYWAHYPGNVIIGMSRFTLHYYSNPFQLQILQTADQHRDSSITAHKRNRHSLATVLHSTECPLFASSGGNKSTWVALLLWWGHYQYQIWITTHHCGLQSVICSSIICDCRAEWHLFVDMKQLQSHFNRVPGGPLLQREVLGNRDQREVFMFSHADE